jgi:hypothetical protein
MTWWERLGCALGRHLWTHRARADQPFSWAVHCVRCGKVKP